MKVCLDINRPSHGRTYLDEPQVLCRQADPAQLVCISKAAVAVAPHNGVAPDDGIAPNH